MEKLLLLLFTGALAWCQTTSDTSGLRNQVTLAGGYARDVNSCCGGDTATGLGATYSHRVWSFLWGEAGVMAALQPLGEIRGAFYDYQPDTRFIWVPFGVRAVAPLTHRIEVSAGTGGVYEKFLVTSAANAFGIASSDGWGGYVTGSAALALDHSRHFWIGASPRFFFANSNNGYAHDRWFMITGDLSFRF